MQETKAELIYQISNHKPLVLIRLQTYNEKENHDVQNSQNKTYHQR
jgi:hypothetical protein